MSYTKHNKNITTWLDESAELTPDQYEHFRRIIEARFSGSAHLRMYSSRLTPSHMSYISEGANSTTKHPSYWWEREVDPNRKIDD